MSSLGPAGSPLESLHDRAVLCTACGYGMIRGETFSSKKRKVLAGELEEVGVFAGFGLVGDDNEGRAGGCGGHGGDSLGTD